jgi:hypothetical protein
VTPPPAGESGTDYERGRFAGELEGASGMTNPKANPESNTEKDPDDWVSGDEPMTGAQASYLKTLSEQAHEPDAFEEGLSKAEASKHIDRLREKIGLAET